MEKKKPLGMRIGESVFCIGYLLFMLYKVFYFKGMPAEGMYYPYCLYMTLLLGGGDSFHLIPRIFINLKGEGEKDAFRLGLGNLVSSVTMTLFYVILPQVIALRHPKWQLPSWLTVILYVLCAARIALCLFPQNNWFSREGNAKWGILRNIPFVIMGVLSVIYLLAIKEVLMAVLVTLSFVCYMAVVLYAHQKPMMGMLMIPKTVCYIWLISLL